MQLSRCTHMSYTHMYRQYSDARSVCTPFPSNPLFVPRVYSFVLLLNGLLWDAWQVAMEHCMRFLGDLIHQDTAGIATAVRCEGTLLQALVAAVSAHIPAEPADSPVGKTSCLLAALQVTAPSITPNVSLLFLPFAYRTCSRSGITV